MDHAAEGEHTFTYQNSGFARGVSLMFHVKGRQPASHVVFTGADMLDAMTAHRGSIASGGIEGHREPVEDTSEVLSVDRWVALAHLPDGRTVWAGYSSALGLLEAVTGRETTAYYRITEPTRCQRCGGTSPSCPRCDGTGEEPEPAPWELPTVRKEV